VSAYQPAKPESVFTDGAPQQRLLATAPKDVTEDDIAGIFRRSLHLW
jgi:hypothetical protein